MSMVSIVMATYNGEKYVGEQIDSILNSTFQDFDLFIFDDGSKDETMSVLQSYRDKYPDKIHVSRNETNRGVTLNFLEAVCRTTADYVMFCDQDDVWKPEKIAVTLKRLRHMEVQFKKELPMAVFTDALVVDENLRVLSESFFRSGRLDPKKTNLSHLLMENKLIGCTVMINAALRRILQSCRLPKNARFHDSWISMIAASFGKISYLNEATLLYRQHEANVVGNKSFVSYCKNRIRNLKKQKESLLDLERQAGEFCEIYKELLSRDSKELIARFAGLSQEGFLQRRVLVLKYDYTKTGLIRNIGLMIIV